MSEDTVLAMPSSNGGTEEEDELLKVIRSGSGRITGVLIEGDNEKFRDELPSGWRTGALPIQSEEEARAVLAAISIYEHRRDSSLKDEAQSVGGRIKALWGL